MLLVEVTLLRLLVETETELFVEIETELLPVLVALALTLCPLTVTLLPGLDRIRADAISPPVTCKAKRATDCRLGFVSTTTRAVPGKVMSSGLPLRLVVAPLILTAVELSAEASPVICSLLPFTDTWTVCPLTDTEKLFEPAKMPSIWSSVSDAFAAKAADAPKDAPKTVEDTAARQAK